MTTTRPRPTTDQPAGREPDERTYGAEPWQPRTTPDELERDHRARDGKPLKDYFERMRERDLLD